MKAHFFMKSPPHKHDEKGAMVEVAPVEYVQFEGGHNGKDVVARVATEADKLKWHHEYAAFKAPPAKKTEPELKAVVVPAPAPEAPVATKKRKGYF